MLIYNELITKYFKDIATDNIEDIIQEKFLSILWRKIWRWEYTSWQNSLREMYIVLMDIGVPDDTKVSIEYNIPWSSKRLDFIITWQNEELEEVMIIIELKQWQEAQLTEKDWVVVTRFEHWLKESSHPSYQAWSYAMLLKSFNSVVYEESIRLEPCAYLHNYKDDWIISHNFYRSHIENAPLFLKNDKIKLREFIEKNIKYWDKKNLMYRVDKWDIRPSKALADSLCGMIKWNQEFIMIDDQKIVYETALNLAKKSSELNKNVLIVEWWPGTWKSVVAINLLVALTKEWLLTQYVTKNSAPRAVYECKLTGHLRKSVISNLFKWSGSFVDCNNNEFNALIVDEAHRLNEKSWMFSNKWVNQVKEIIDSSKFSIFFIDEDQKVTFKDIWEKEEIIKWAKSAWAKVHNLDLSSQFRCNWSDWYLAWLDNILDIRLTANTELDKESYDFRIMSSPNELRDIIFEKNKINNKARLVAWYCWEWTSKNDKDAFDINIPEYDFKMKWNLATDWMLWILSPGSVNEIGCIHTCQWLEVDYVWVIVWNDFIVRNWEVLVDPSKRAKSDASLKWYKSAMKANPEDTKKFVKALIKNTYRTLMTRWMKGCYVYFVDKETEEYFKKNLN
ncbi:MAG: hypothetical protein ACD_3C00033G0003 [uncultured bacterium (gcode 4)]|uniref:Schlafen group 3-like DNA/RNA helicase domain-containing protein n=1 Tax=uncultured bacterium (gcode 4) TaxID=1234023 RepID=K2GZ02_9BACT|nr:MAG: hypothetical protein ACD_3C00033G0003 [uncultured bacterium (gcode 4)]